MADDAPYTFLEEPRKKRSRFESAAEAFDHLDKWEGFIRKLAVSKNEAHQARAREELELWKAATDKERQYWVTEDLPVVPGQEVVEPLDEDIIVKAHRETGSVLGPTPIKPERALDVGSSISDARLAAMAAAEGADYQPSDWAKDLLKEQTTPQSASLWGSILGMYPAVKAMEAVPARQAAAKATRLLGGLFTPVLTGTLAHQLAALQPEHREELGWGDLSGTSLQPWDVGKGALGAAESLLGWELMGQGLVPALKKPIDLVRYGLMGGSGASQRARDLLAAYRNVDMPWTRRESLLSKGSQTMERLTPAYAASKLGFIQAMGPGVLKLPGLRGGALKRYRQTMEGIKEGLVRRLEHMLPSTYGLSHRKVGERMYKEAMKYGIKSLKAIDNMYKRAFGEAEKLYGDAPVISLRSFLGVVDEISSGTTRVFTKDGLPLKAPTPEKIGNWVKDHLSNLSPTTSVGGMRDLQSLIRRQLEVRNKDMEGFQELTQLNNALTGTMESFFSKGRIIPGVDVSQEAARNVAKLFKEADNTNRVFWSRVDTPAGKEFEKVTKTMWEYRHLYPRGREGASVRRRYIKAGDIKAEKLFDTAFAYRDPAYLDDLREIIGPKAYKMASQRWLNNAVQESLMDGRMVDVKSFLELTRLEKDPEMVAALLKGSGVTVEGLSSIARVLKDHPVDENLLVMMIRRVQLQGAKSIPRMGVGGALMSGAVAGSAVTGGASLIGILAVLGASRMLATALSKPNMLRALAEYGQSTPEVFKSRARRRAIPSSVIKFLRVWNAEMGEENRIDVNDLTPDKMSSGPEDRALLEKLLQYSKEGGILLEKATRPIDPLIEHVSPIDEYGNVRWTGWRSKGQGLPLLVR